MIKIENVETCGWESAIRGMRNPLNSWNKSDTAFWSYPEKDVAHKIIGPNDLDLMKRLCNAGTDHRKFMRMIVVYCDVTAPLYFWKEADTYQIGVTKNSCSTMHKIADKEFTLDDFSHEHLVPEANVMLKDLIIMLNEYRKIYLQVKNKEYWWQMIQLLPSSYNQKRTVMLNYEVLANIYKSRKNHKLDEWHIFCDWVQTMPYSELITGKDI